MKVLLIIALLIAASLVYIAFKNKEDFIQLMILFTTSLVLIVAIPFHLLFNREVKEHRRKMLDFYNKNK